MTVPASASQNCGGYSLCTAVLNFPSFPMPIATSVGFCAPTTCLLYIEAANLGSLTAKRPVGLLTEQPHLHCATVCRAIAGCLQRSCSHGVNQILAASGCWGGAGCSLRYTPPVMIVHATVISICIKNSEPCLNCLSSLKVRCCFPKRRHRSLKGLGNRRPSFPSSGDKR